MTTKNKQRQKQIPCGNDKQERQEQQQNEEARWLASLFVFAVRWLEQQLQSKLYLAAGVGRCRDNPGRAQSGSRGLVGGCALCGAGGVDDLIWQLQVGVVQDVEEL